MIQMFKPKATVKQIHNEFDSAQERLLMEAKEVLSEGDDATHIAYELGFINTPSGKNAAIKSKSVKEAKQKASIIEYYKQSYPFQKFITEQEMDRICTKYGLIHAPIGCYIKDVPQKNLLEIKNSKKLKEQDAADDVKRCKVEFHSWLFPDSTFLSIWSKWRYELPRLVDGHFRDGFDVEAMFKKQHEIPIMYLVNGIKNITINRQGLFIAAPQSHFDLSGKRAHGKYGFFSFSVHEVKDPIVFRYCKGGIQILSKWGDEASDDLVVNENMN